MIESICASYATQYNVPAKVIRLTQTFGTRVRKEDNRVYPQFICSCMLQDDIILLISDGTTSLFTMLLKGMDGVKLIMQLIRKYTEI